MAESTLSLSYTDISAEVGRFLGYGRTSANWTSDQTSDINRCVDSGYSLFLRSSNWSFTRQIGTITTVSGDYDYDLPDNFGSMRGPMTYPIDTGRDPIKFVSEGQIRALKGRVDQSDYPDFAAVRPKDNDGTDGQRYEVLLFPNPNVVKVLSYPYNVFIGRIRTAAPYPLGGMAHGETILEACLSSAESYFNDQAGIHTQKFTQVLLPLSKKEDAKLMPASLGYNGDSGDFDFSQTLEANRTVTVNGVTPT